MPRRYFQGSIEEFRKNIEPLYDQWKSLDIRVVAVRSGNGVSSPLSNLATKIILSPTPPDALTIQADLPNSELLRARHLVWPIDELDKLLSKLAEEGALIIDGVEVQYRDRERSIEFSPSFFKGQKGERYTSSPRDWTYYCLRSSRGAPPLPHDIDEGLKSLDAPYQSLQELLREFCLLRGSPEYVEPGRVEIEAPVGIRISDARLRRDGALRLELELEAMPFWVPRDIDFGLIHRFTSGATERGSYKPAQLVLDKRQRAVVTILSPVDSYSSTVILRTRKVPVDEVPILNPAVNARLNVYEQFDPNLERLKTWLATVGDSGERFEKAIESLLFVNGLCVAPFVKELKQDGRVDVRGVDGLVMGRGGSVFAIECTTGPFTTEKLERLRYRARSLADVGYQVHAVAFTTTRRESIGAEVMNKAAKDRISIVAEDNIRTLLEMAERNAGADEVNVYLYQCVPAPGRDFV